MYASEARPVTCLFPLLFLLETQVLVHLGKACTPEGTGPTHACCWGLMHPTHSPTWSEGGPAVPVHSERDPESSQGKKNSDLVIYSFLKDFIYLFMRDTERGAETQAEGEAGSLRGARCGTWSQDPGITPWAEGRCSTTESSRLP